jgi:hypothetical protein
MRKSGHERSGGGSFNYLDDQLRFPFKAVCTVRRASSPLRVEDLVEGIGLAGGEECEHGIFVTIRQGTDDLAAPLSQLEAGSGHWRCHPPSG